MKYYKRYYNIISLVIIVCLIMAYVEMIMIPHYFVKSVIKLALFLLVPIAYSLLNNHMNFKSLFRIQWKSVLWGLLIGLGVFVFIVVGYMIIEPYYDLSEIPSTLMNNLGVNKNNFIYVAIYISLINSFLEEFFFRGFAYFSLKLNSSKKLANIFSALMFSVYHIAIIDGWFKLSLTVLVLTCLFIGGLIFNYLNEKSESIYPSWLVHLCANLGINFIGLILFEII